MVGTQMWGGQALRTWFSIDKDAIERADGVWAKGRCGLRAAWKCAVPHELEEEPAVIVGRMLPGVPGPAAQNPAPAPQWTAVDDRRADRAIGNIKRGCGPGAY